MATIDEFQKIDIRVGTILEAIINQKARKPAYRLKIDFGKEIGIKTSSAQITERYQPEDLIGMQIIGVVNFPSRRIADVTSEVLVLGTDSKQGIVLLNPTEKSKMEILFVKGKQHRKFRKFSQKRNKKRIK